MDTCANVNQLYRRFRTAAIACVLLAGASQVQARTVTAMWDANTDGITTGYHLFYGTTSGVYNTQFNVGNVTSYQVNLNPGPTYYFIVRAANAAGVMGPASAEVVFTLPNSAPVLANPGNQAGVPNSFVSLTLSATDPNGDPVTYSATGLPGSLSVNPSTGLISGALGPGTVGTYNVTVTATDGGMSNIKQFTWTIRNRVTGDFNLDFKGDVIWRNKATGQNIGWLMSGLSVASSAFLPTIADTNWEVQGAGDFDGDGKADTLLRNLATGQNIGWVMNGLAVSSSAFLPTIADTNWEIKGVADFNGDGKSDVILRNKATGQNIGWLMNGLAVAGSAFMPTIADTNWDIVGVGDLNGDGKADVLLRNKVTGQDIGWLMNGLTVAASAFLPTIADTNWEIKGVGDFNGDGKADVLLRNKASGQNIGWLMNGLVVSSSAFLSTIADLNWSIKAVTDFDGDGRADVLWRNGTTGQNIGWLMNGLTVANSAFLSTIADTNWEVVGP